MPISSIEQARDLIIGQFLDEWNTLASPPKVLYADRVGEPPDESEAWARISVQHSLASQVTLGGPAGKRFRRFGTVLVNILTPYGEGLTTSDVLVQKAVRGDQMSGGIASTSDGIDGGMFDKGEGVGNFPRDPCRNPLILPREGIAIG